MKKILSLALSALMLLSLFAFVSCDEQTINDVADLALELVEAIPDADESDSADTSEEKQSETEPDTETESETETETQTETETESETEAESETETETETETESETETETESEPETEPAPVIDEFGSYDDKDNVALYIHTYGKLPPNYITKAEAEDLGWTGGSVEKYAEGKCIGGAKFGNYEGLLPKKSGRQYYECDIDTLGESSRGAKRIVYSNDGLIYYTDDHYETFELLYGEE